MRNPLDPVIGRVRWSAPPWLLALGRVMRVHPRRSWGVFAGLIVLLAAVVTGYLVWQSLPQPVLTQVRVAAPQVTRIGTDGKLHPQPVTLTFQTHYEDPTEQGPRGAAKLALIGKTLDQGIELQPAQPGQWQWLDENTLRFTPAEDWPAGQQYTVQLQQALFAPGIQLAEKAPTFTSPRMTARLHKLEFYQNPDKPSEHRVVATLVFTQPVAEGSLKSHLTLAMRPSGAAPDVAPQAQDYSVRFDEHRRRAYITSAPIPIPEHENHMTLMLGKGVQAARGRSRTQHEHQQSVTIPARSTFFRVDSLAAQIVRNKADEPQQTLVLAVTDGIQAKRVANRMQAYLLPERDERWQRGDIDADVLAQSTQIELHANASAHAYAKLLSFRFQAPPGRQMWVRLPSGLVSHGGYTMTTAYRDVLSIPDYPKQAQIVAEGSLLALSGDRTIALQARGVPALRVRVYPLLDSQIVHLVTQTRGDLAQADFRFYGFDENNIARRFTRILPLDNAQPGQVNYASLDLSDYLHTQADGSGLFVVTVAGWDAANKRVISGTRDRRFLLLTDLSLIAKDNADHTHDLFVHSLAGDGAVAGAEVALLGVNGQPVYRTTTDARGRAHLPDVRSLGGPQQPAVYVVRHADDMAFLPFDRAGRKLHFSRFDVGGLRTDDQGPAAGLRADVFTDRGIYRPGSKGHLGLIIKRNDWQRVAGLPVAIKLTGPRGNTVRDERKSLPASGFLELPLAFERTDPTGTYRAAVYLLDHAEHRHRIGGVAFRVEQFKPDTLRIQASMPDSSTAGWHTGLQLQGHVTLQNLFGMAAQGHRVTAEYTLIPVQFSFEAYPGFVFADPFRKRDDRLDHRVTEELADAETAADGKADFAIDLSDYGQGLYRLVFEATGFDSGGGNEVTARSSMLVSPAEFLVGWSSKANLDYLRRDSKHRIQFIAINAQAEQVAMQDLTLRVIERKPVSTLVRQPDGTLAYRTITKRVPVSNTNFDIAADGSDWSFPTAEPGDYVVELVSADDRVIAAVDYTVAGGRNIAGAVSSRAQLRLDLDQHEYQPGDTIDVQITTPYAGSGLITIERDHVYAFKWFSADQGRSVQHIKLPEGLETNGYINVTFVRALDSQKIFTQPLSYAVAPFGIDRSPHAIDIELQAPDRVKPGDVLPIHFQTSRPGQIVVYAVDSGILQVAGYVTPQPLDFFLSKRALQVGTAQMADLLLPEYHLLLNRLTPGGGKMAAAERALRSNLNPFQRNVKAPAVFWSGIIDASGEPQTVHYPVPDDFDGGLRLMAVAVADDAVGSAEQHTLVRGPFVLQPDVITKAAPGDEFQVSVGVTNALPAASGDARITVQLAHDEHLDVLGEASRQLTLAAGREGRATFKVRATDKPGSSELVFSARAGEHRVRRSVSLSVRPALRHVTTLASGSSTSGRAELELPRLLQPALASQHAAAGYSPLVLADGLVHFLRDYPHACSEQLVSRVFPLLGLLDAPMAGVEPEPLMRRYQDLLDTLRVRQQADGGFGMWPGARQALPFVSVYIMHFLTDADTAGRAVPRQLFADGLDYLHTLAGKPPGRVSPYVQAYAIYVLTRNGQVTTNDLTRLQDDLERDDADGWRQTLAAAYMAAAYKLLRLDDTASKIIAGFEPLEAGAERPVGMLSAAGANAQYIYLLARHFPQRLHKLDGDWVLRLTQAVADGRFNTLSSAYTLLAFDAWADRARTQAPDALKIIGITAAGEDGKSQPRTLVDSREGQARVSVPLTVRTLRYQGDAAQRMFYSASQAGYNATLPDKARHQGLEIVREYLDGDGHVVNEATLGDELTARIRIRSLDGHYHPNVAIVDLLPAAFTAERDSLRNNGQDKAHYADVREDRVVFYTGVGEHVMTLTYTVRVDAAGRFTVPAAYATAMYARQVRAHSAAGRFHVERP